MSVYFLAEIEEIKDNVMYREYVEKASPIVTKFGGKYIIKSEKLQPTTKDWDVVRIILIKFENKDNLHNCFNSEEYKKIKHLREISVKSKAAVIEE